MFKDRGSDPVNRTLVRMFPGEMQSDPRKLSHRSFYLRLNLMLRKKKKKEINVRNRK